jgi:hypothetical protein
VPGRPDKLHLDRPNLAKGFLAKGNLGKNLLLKANDSKCFYLKTCPEPEIGS